MINSNYSILIYIIMPLSDHTILNLKILYNLIYYKDIKYIVSTYNIPSKAYKKLLNGLAVL